MSYATIQLLRGIGATSPIVMDEIVITGSAGESGSDSTATDWKKLAKQYAPYVIGGAAVIYFGRKLLRRQRIPADQRARAARLRRASAAASQGMAGARRRRRKSRR